MDKRYPWRAVRIIAVALVAVSACSATPAVSSTPTRPASTSTPASGATVAPTVAPTTALALVDLVLSGDFAVVAKGTAGQCTLGQDSAGNAASFGFGAVQADYPGLGQGLYVSEGKNGFVTIKWLLDASTGLINAADQQGVSADDHSITIDVDLAGGTVKEHIKGTIACP